MNNNPNNLPIANPHSRQLVQAVGASLKVTAKLLAQSHAPSERDWAWWHGLNDWWKFILLENLKEDGIWKFRFYSYNSGKFYFNNDVVSIDLTISANQLKKICQMEYIYGICADLDKILPLAHLTHLTRLNLAYNKIKDLGILAHLTQLTKLNLWANWKITDIESLVYLTQLTELDLSWNNITDIGALAHLTQLIKLDLCDNKITDPSPLVYLTQLVWLNLSDNPITKEQVQWLRAQLPNTTIYY